MYVIGTAGHVDHGKSALVQALTGIDPDRLQEEKERGLTIDLGFAWLTLPSGREVSIVDVPGHERFIKNMLAGVGSIDLALLVVAADEGVMPQTREHLAIVDLLRIDRHLVVITKKDLVEDDWLELVEADIQDAIEGTSLEGAQIMAVSSITGDGLDDLVAAVDGMLQEATPKQDIGRPRLPIDRTFTISGFGTVVTGTLIDGKLTVGQEVEVVPGAIKSRIRGIQTHKNKVEVGSPGSRVAANISGVGHAEIRRGQVLTSPGWLRESTAVDVRLRIIPDCPISIRHNAAVTLHMGTSETPALVRLLDSQELEPGAEGWAQLRLQDPIAFIKGDLFIIRSHLGTLGGGEVVETQPKRHKRFHDKTVERLEVLAQGTPGQVLIKVLESSEPLSVKNLVRISTLAEDTAREAVRALHEEKGIVVLGKDGLQGNPLLYSYAGWQTVRENSEEYLRGYHEQNPLRPGAPKEEFRGRLKLSAQAFPQVMERLKEEAVVVEEGASVRLPSHTRTVSQGQQQEINAYLKALAGNPFSPPTDISILPELLSGLVEEGKVIRVSGDVVFEAGAYQKMVDQVVEEVRAEGKVTVARVRDMFKTSRKYALAFMEYLDQEKITRRVGDDRVLR